MTISKQNMLTEGEVKKKGKALNYQEGLLCKLQLSHFLPIDNRNFAPQGLA